jgi:hypothetical protein
MQPADEQRVRIERRRFARQINKNGLRHVPRLGVVTHLPQRGRVNRVGVAPDNLAERGVAPHCCVFAQEFGVSLRLHFHK